MKGNLSIFNYNEYPFILDFIEKNLKGKCLDVGCFKGGVMALVKNGNVVGIDIDEWALRENVLKRKVAVADAGSLPLKEEAFDTVFCGFVLSYVADKESAVNEIGRVLKKGGRGIFVLHHPNGSIGKVNKEFVKNYEKNTEFLKNLDAADGWDKIKENPFASKYCQFYRHKFKGVPDVSDFLEKLSVQYRLSFFFSQNKFRSIGEIISLFAQNGPAINSYFDITIPCECGHIYDSVLLSEPIERKLLLFLIKKNGPPLELQKSIFFKKSLSREEYKIEAHTPL